MRKLIFGPPGIGKSTICGDSFFDLERLEDKQQRLNMIRSVDMIFGAADISPATLRKVQQK